MPKDKEQARNQKIEKAGNPNTSVTPNTSTSAKPPLTDEERRRWAALGISTGPLPSQQQQEPPKGGLGPLDILVITENGPLEPGETLTLPSGTTLQNKPVPLGNGLGGVETTMTMPGYDPLVWKAEAGYAPNELAGLYSTTPSYTAAQRDNDLAVVNGTAAGPYTDAMRAYAAARLNAHWNPAAAPRLVDGSVVMPRPGYSATQLSNDLGWASTTGPLDEPSERRRREAAERLANYAYTVRQQDDDQIYIQLGNFAPNHPAYREELRRLIASGVPGKQAESVLVDRIAAARNRLETAGIPQLSPEAAEQLRNAPRSYSYDPRIPFIPDESPYVPTHDPGLYPNLYRPGLMNESEFRHGLGELTGLADLTEGLENGDYGQAAFGAGLAALTFVPGLDMLILGKIGKGLERFGTIPGEAAGTGAFGGGARVGSEGLGPMYHPWDTRPGTSLVLPEGAGVRPTVPGPRGFEHPGVPSNPGAGTHLSTEVPPGAAIPDRPGGGYGARPPWSRTDPAGIDGPDINDPRADPFGPRTRPGTDIPRRFPGEHGGFGPNPGVGARPALPEGRELPPGITREGEPGKPTSWRNQQGRYTKKEPWDASPSDSALPGKLLDDPIAQIPIDSLPARERWMLGEVDAAQNASKAVRDQNIAEIEAMLDSRQTKLMVSDGKGGLREATVKDFSGERFDRTLDSLDESHQLKLTDPESIRLAELAKSLREQRAAVSRLPEVRGEIGGDYYARKARIDVIHEGSGNYTADRLGVVTLPDGTRRVVLLEYKGGDSATQFGSRQIDVGLDKPVPFEQGTLPYAQDEFLRPDSESLAALRAYDEKNGTDLAEQLLSGRQDFDYVLVHTDPNTGTITAYNVDPQTAKNFTLGQPGGPPPPSATPIAATTGGIDGAPSNWLGGLALPDLHNLAGWTAPVLPVIAPFLPRQDRAGADQSLVIDISMPAMDQRRVLDRESAAVLTHGAHIR
ncbi:hypothetical protein [Nocardia bovistercoris]|uniref:Uncharacterized protein n=1 Tax=Nocardia bovistercoris TaxID=2785916 RepID=A0A931N757_9NOCA|nr:hypothetical protein [Nocardia bovistercoris]MBH0781714.1 hypothetical protein [Nocardia bovistercoris]